MPKRTGLAVTRIDPGQEPEAELIVIKLYASGWADLVLDDGTVLQVDPAAAVEMRAALAAPTEARILPVLGEVA